MSKNIYDLFNERKNGIDYLVEGLDPAEYEELEAYEDLAEAAYALDEISMESTNEMIEFQAACYLEDLVLENMMFEEFDEEKIASVMEASKGEKSEGLGQKIKNLWQRIKEWFARAFKTIVNHFQSGETLVAKYRKEIPAAMRQSNAKIKSMPLDRDPGEAISQIKAMGNRVKVVGKTKEQILGALGVSDKSGIKGRVEAIFYSGKEKTEKAIKDLKPDMVMKWASNKKVFIDGLKKYQKDLDGEFKEMLALINKGNDGDKASKAADFQFGINLVNAMLSHTIVCIRQISNACTAVIRKALSGKYDVDKKEDTDSSDRKAEKAAAEKYGKKVGAKMGADIARPKLGGETKKADKPKAKKASVGLGDSRPKKLGSGIEVDYNKTDYINMNSWEIEDEYDDIYEESYEADFEIIEEDNTEDFEW